MDSPLAPPAQRRAGFGASALKSGSMRRLLLLVFLLSPALFAQSIDSNAVDRLARDTMRRWKIPGIAIAIVDNDRVVYLKGFGVRELGSPAPVTADTLFQIASTSKAFTTTSMAMLVDEKKMNWDDPVHKYLEYFRLSDACADSMVTLRDIVSHRTGLDEHDEKWDYTQMSREEMLRRESAVKLNKPFRTAYQYNNTMFIAAGEAVAAAAKMPWSDFVRTRIFEPLGMRATVISESDWMRAEHAQGHFYDSTRDVVQPQTMQPYETLGPGGGIKSSARDMAQWVRFQLSDGVVDGKRLVSVEALSETKSPQTIIPLAGGAKERNPESNLYDYGMGWFIQDYRGELLVFHTGSLNGFRTQVDLLPHQKSGFVILSNLGRSNALIALRNSLVDLLLRKPSPRDWNAYYLALDAKSFADEKKKKADAEAKRRRDTHPSRELAAYAGTYESPAYGPLTVAVSGDRLTLTYGRLVLPLTHYHYDTFAAVSDEEEIDERITFSLDADGEVKSLTFFGETYTKATALPAHS